MASSYNAYQLRRRLIALGGAGERIAMYGDSNSALGRLGTWGHLWGAGSKLGDNIGLAGTFLQNPSTNGTYYTQTTKGPGISTVPNDNNTKFLSGKQREGYRYYTLEDLDSGDTWPRYFANQRTAYFGDGQAMLLKSLFHPPDSGAADVMTQVTVRAGRAASSTPDNSKVDDTEALVLGTGGVPVSTGWLNITGPTSGDLTGAYVTSSGSTTGDFAAFIGHLLVRDAGGSTPDTSAPWWLGIVQDGGWTAGLHADPAPSDSYGGWHADRVAAHYDAMGYEPTMIWWWLGANDMTSGLQVTPRQFAINLHAAADRVDAMLSEPPLHVFMHYYNFPDLHTNRSASAASYFGQSTANQQLTDSFHRAYWLEVVKSIELGSNRCTINVAEQQGYELGSSGDNLDFLEDGVHVTQNDQADIQTVSDAIYDAIDGAVDESLSLPFRITANWPLDDTAESAAVGNTEGAAAAIVGGSNASDLAVGTAQGPYRTSAGFALDGSSDYVQGTVPAINSYPFTLAGWGYNEGVSSSGTVVSLSVAAATTRFFLIAMTSAGNIQVVRRNTTAYGTTSATAYSLNEWHHLGAVFHSETAFDLYVDGVLREQFTGLDSVSFLGNQFTVLLGGQTRPSSPADHLQGRIAFLRVMDSAATAAEMAAMFKSDAGLADNQLLVESLTAK